METNKVIHDLVEDLRPVKPIPAFAARLSLWLACAAGTSIALILFVAASRDLELALRASRLAMDGGAVLVLAVTAAWAALRLSVPGEENPWAHKYVPVALLALWTIFALVQVAVHASRAGIEAVIPDPHLACALLTAGAGGLLMVPLGILLRSAAPLDTRWCGAMAGLAAGSAAMVGIEFLCVYERPAHFAVYHVLPVTLFTIAGAIAGPKFLKAA